MHRAPARRCGFTLIELLVVVIIIGVIVSMATLSVSVLGRDSQAEEQARRFWTILRQAREEAELQGFNIGVYLAAEEYEFLRFDALTNTWHPMPQDKLYATRRLPEGLRHRVWLDSREIILKPQLPEREPDEPLSDEEQEEADLPPALRTIQRTAKPRKQAHPPQIVVLSSGDIMPFELQIERDRKPALWRVVGTPENDLRLEERRDSVESWRIVMQTHVPWEASERTADARR